MGFLSTLCVCLCQFELWWSLLTLNSLTSSCRGQKYLSTVAEKCGAEWTFWGGLLRLCAEIWGPSQKTLSSRLTRAASVHVAFCLQDQKEIASRWMEFLRNQYVSSPFPCLFLFVVSSLERLFHRNYAAEKEINGCVLVSFWSKKEGGFYCTAFRCWKVVSSSLAHVTGELSIHFTSAVDSSLETEFLSVLVLWKVLKYSLWLKLFPSAWKTTVKLLMQFCC